MHLSWPLPNILFEGVLQERPVTLGPLSQNKQTQVFGWVDEDGRLAVGIMIYHNGEPAQMIMCCLPQQANVFLCYRAFQLLERLLTVRDTDARSIIELCLMGKEPEGEEDRALIEWVENAVGNKELAQIAVAVPADPFQLIQSVAALNVTLDRDAVTDEIEAGRLDYRDCLAALKIEHPDTRRARLEKRKQLYGEWEPHFLVYYEAKNVPSEDRKDALQYCNRIALYASAKGVEAADLCVGIALYIFALRSDSIAGIAAAIAKVLTRGDTPIGGLFVGRGSIEATTLQLLTTFLESRFASREAHQYASLLKQLYNDLEKMPVVHPDL